ncbi:hypothetical protein HLB44_10820 [Aquincola sp. S2]|uniref:Uncharacterized protein n=1 Tax=Pseudaquabacterium terrae TaxID=2732868 RepID=A0ABX2EFU0_9BURK|nr:hypothetical protein [Aquabacterium terrae]NRF67478.1 hypothetical protein [Aquabacterium terrae]
MLRKLVRFVLFAALALFGLVAALLAYLAYAEHQAKEHARAFCDSVKVGDDPLGVVVRATRSEALRSSLTWRPADGNTKTLEVLFAGGIPLSAHGCRIQASEQVMSAAYFHTR